MQTFSIIIISNGREELLSKCLDSLPKDISDWELILHQNGSKLSAEIIQKAQSICTNFTFIETQNVLSRGAARNEALEAASGDWVVFLDEEVHTLAGYWELVSSILQDEKIDVLGGPEVPVLGVDTFTLALAKALSSPFTMGPAYTRYRSVGTKLTATDADKLTANNLWIKRSKLEGVHFPEDYLTGDETMLLQELVKNGCKLFYHPKLKVTHHRVAKLTEIWKTFFDMGFFRSKLIREKMQSGNEVYWLPAIMVLLHLVIIIDPTSFWYLARLYGSIIVFISITLSMQARRFWLFPQIAFLQYFIVMMYGVGFLTERVMGKRSIG